MKTLAGLLACVDEGNWAFQRGEPLNQTVWTSGTNTKKAQEEVAAMNCAHSYGWYLGQAGFLFPKRREI